MLSPFLYIARKKFVKRYIFPRHSLYRWKFFWIFLHTKLGDQRSPHCTVTPANLHLVEYQAHCEVNIPDHGSLHPKRNNWKIVHIGLMLSRSVNEPP